MATAKKSTKSHRNSRAAKMRKYFTAHPSVTVKQVADIFKTVSGHQKVAGSTQTATVENTTGGDKQHANHNDRASRRPCESSCPLQGRWNRDHRLHRGKEPWLQPWQRGEVHHTLRPQRRQATRFAESGVVSQPRNRSTVI